jgi:hypothetical protein
MRTTNYFNLTTSASGLPASGDYDGQEIFDSTGGVDNKGMGLVWRDEHWDGFRTWASGWYGASSTPWAPKSVSEVLDYTTTYVNNDFVSAYFDTTSYILWFVFRYESGTEYDIQVGASAADLDYYIYVEDENYDSANPIASGRVLGKSGSDNDTATVTPPDTDRMLCWCKVVTNADDVDDRGTPEADFTVTPALGGP